MLSLDPAHRLTFSDYLTRNRGTAFPEIFYTFLYPFISSLDSAAVHVPSSAPQGGRATTTGKAPSVDGVGAQQQAQQAPILLRTDADEKIERIGTEWEMVSRYLDETVPEPPGEDTSPAGDTEGLRAEVRPHPCRE